MRKLKKSLTIAFLICLNSCSPPKIDDQIQCSPDFNFITDNSRRYIDEDITTCRCRMYRLSPEYVGPVGSFWHEDIDYCQKLIGHPPDAYLNVADFYERVRKAYQDAQGKKK